MVVNIMTAKVLATAFIVCLFPLSISAQQPFSREQFTSDFDQMWSSLRDNYAYFDKKETDWNKVRELYRPKLAEVKSRSDFVNLLERVLDELYDYHIKAQLDWMIPSLPLRVLTRGAPAFYL